MTAIVIRGDAACLPLPDNSVDLLVTSPPYFALRSYQDGGVHYENQIGSEATPQEFLDALWRCTAEWKRVLKPSGSLFVNLGDKYAGSASGGTQNGACGSDTGRKRGKVRTAQGIMPQTPVLPKSLIGIPWRYAIGGIDQLGLILRAELIWAKPNGLPESVTDRVRRSHENWFHFTLQPRYYAGVDEIREQAQQQRPQAVRAQQLAARHGLTDAHRDALLARGLGDTGRSAAVQSGTGKNSDEVLRLAEEADRALGGYAREFTMTSQSLGKLPGSVWEIPSEPLTVPAHLGVDHFAAFPSAWPKRLILGWSPSGICTACDSGHEPIVDAKPMVVRPSARRLEAQASGNAQRTSTSGTMLEPASRTILGYACPNGCDAPTRPSVVLDPFGGTGTTAAVASALGRIGISVDLSHDYSRLAQWRTTDPATRAKIRGERPPVKQADGQEELFGSVA